MSIENLIGQTFGQCELRELLGVGGMGAVYRAYQKSLKREVAVKVISTALSQQSGYRERFFREAETAAALEDAHIIPIYDFGTQGQISYLVMRLLTGGSLSERIKQRADTDHPLPSLKETADLLNQLAGALDYAHSQGVIHRDIKPSNIMFDHKGTAFVVDFGVARLVQATTALTGTGTTLGTPLYMPPEQWRNENLTSASDQYALGVMIYQLITGRVPFLADTPYALMHLHLNEMPTPPQITRADVPESVALVLERALAKKPENRFPTVTAFAQAFERAAVGYEGMPTEYFTYKLRRSTITGRPASQSKPNTHPSQPQIPFYKRPVAWVGGVIALLLLALVALLIAPQGTLPTAPSSPTATLTAIPIIAVMPSDTPNVTFTPTPTLTAIPSPTTDSQIVALTNIALQAAAVVQTATAEQQNRDVTSTAQHIQQMTQDAAAAASQSTLQAAQDAATAVALSITQAVLDQTLTAEAWTDTPMPTATDAPSPTTIPASATPRPTEIPIPTAEPTVEVTAEMTTEAWTNTPIPTAEMTAEATAEVAPLGTAGNPVTANAQWTPVVQDFDGVPMVLVPAGCFMMGSNTFEDQQPVHRQCFDAPFWIDQTEVTNEQYYRIMGLGESADNAQLPFLDVNWFGAKDYCAVRGMQLPSEREWEYAARGPSSFIFPWGNTYESGLAVEDSSPHEVGTLPQGRSWVGALDMAGNAAEWTSSLYAPYPYDPTDGRENLSDSTGARIARGIGSGSDNPSIYMQPSYRQVVIDPNWAIQGGSFRCARSNDSAASPVIAATAEMTTEATAEVASLPLTKEFISQSNPLRFKVPETWAFSEPSNGIVVVGNSDSMIQSTGSTWSAGMFGIVIVRLEPAFVAGVDFDQITLDMPVSEVMKQLIADSTELTDLSEVTLYDIYGLPAARVQGLDTSSGNVQVVTVFKPEGADTWLIAVAIALPDEINTFLPTLDDILESVRWNPSLPAATFTPTPTFTATPKPAHTPVPPSSTPTPIATATPTATATSVPTLTPSRTPVPPTSTPTNVRATSMPLNPVAIVNTSSANLRNGPGTNYDIVGSVQQGDQLPIVAQADNNSWYLITRTDGRRAWIAARIVIVAPPEAVIQAVATIPPTAETVITGTSLSLQPTAALLRIDHPEACRWIPIMQLTGFAPNSVITITNQYTETSCGETQARDLSWTDTRGFFRTDANGSVQIGLLHGGWGTYNFVFYDEAGRSASLTVSYTNQ